MSTNLASFRHFLARFQSSRAVLSRRRTPSRRLQLALLIVISVFGTTVVPDSVAGASSAPSGWSIEPAPAQPVVQGGLSYNPISCASKTFCMGAWGFGGSPAAAVRFATWDMNPQDGWHSTTNLPTSIAYPTVFGLSCPSAKVCFAVGEMSGPRGPGVQIAMMARWNGSVWSVQQQPDLLTPNGSSLDSISCVSATFCVAVGAYAQNSTLLAFAEVWNGSVWRPTTFPLTGSEGRAVSCITKTFCAALTEHNQSFADTGAYVQTWNGTAWQNVRKVGDGAGIGPLLACTSTSFCMADTGDAVMWNGATWLPLSTSPTGLIITLSCASRLECVAMSNLAGYSIWNGASWQTGNATIPSPAGALTLYLDGIACPTPTECVSIGDSILNLNPTQTSVPLVEMFTGGVPTVPSYVALGDSYSSGEGIPPYFEPNNKCHRSESAYPTAVAAEETQLRFGFLACSGATSSQVLARQVTTASDKKNSNWTPLSTSTKIVTITAGGDDVGWSKVIPFCYNQFTNCEDIPYQGYPTLGAYASHQFGQLKPELVALYQGIARLAPNARILVLGYPQLLPATPSEQGCFKLRLGGGGAPGLDYDEQSWIRIADNELNATIAEAVNQSSVNATFLPVASVFAGHEVCGSLGEWINGPSLTLVRHHWKVSKSARTFSFHPNRLGQAEYASLIESYLSSH